MKEALNPPSRIRNNLETAPIRMGKVDAYIAEETLTLFAVSTSRILEHTEVKAGTINNHIPMPIASEVTLLLVSAASELETAWNVLRLANVSASRRQGRVAEELVALAVLVAVPIHVLQSLPSGYGLKGVIKKNPGRTVSELYRPIIKKQGRKTIVTDPPLKARDIYPAFLRICTQNLGLSDKVVQNLREYRDRVQHPASHASVDTWVLHFEGFETIGRRAGAWFTKKRGSSYTQASEDLANLSGWMANILDQVAIELEKTNPKPEV